MEAEALSSALVFEVVRGKRVIKAVSPLNSHNVKTRGSGFEVMRVWGVPAFAAIGRLVWWFLV